MKSEGDNVELISNHETNIPNTFNREIQINYYIKEKMFTLVIAATNIINISIAIYHDFNTVRVHPSLGNGIEVFNNDNRDIIKELKMQVKNTLNSFFNEIKKVISGEDFNTFDVKIRDHLRVLFPNLGI